MEVECRLNNGTGWWIIVNKENKTQRTVTFGKKAKHAYLVFLTKGKHEWVGIIRGLIMQENKICSRCKENKSVELFYKRSGAKGYHSLCKDCEKTINKGVV